MDTLSRRLPGWRRPPLILVAVALAITYAELAIQSQILVENELTINKTGSEPSIAGNVGEDVVGALVHHDIMDPPAVGRLKTVRPVCGHFC